MPFTATALNTMLDSFVTTEGTLYVALFVGDPTGAGTECTGTGYERQDVATWAAASGGSKASSAEVLFDNAGNAWSAGVNYWAVYDALSGGNLLASGTLGGTRDMSIANATLTIASGAITLSLS